MDTDAQVVLTASLLIVLFNLVFIFSISVYMCCCIDVINMKPISLKKKNFCKMFLANSKTTRENNDKFQQLNKVNELDNLVFHAICDDFE